MGGNLWFFGATADGALEAADRAAKAAAGGAGRDPAVPRRRGVERVEGGQPVQVHDRQHLRRVLPDLREKLGDESRLPAGVASVQEIIINGRDLPTIVKATQAAIAASVETPGLLKISAGNYGGRLGKSFIYLHPEKQPA